VQRQQPRERGIIGLNVFMLRWYARRPGHAESIYATQARAGGGGPRTPGSLQLLLSENPERVRGRYGQPQKNVNSASVQKNIYVASC
jgi:hypothetical protein